MQGQLTTTIKGKLQTYDFKVPLYIVPGSGYNSAFAALELTGPSSAIRAAWAHLIKHREGDYERTDVKINILGDWENVYVIPKKKIICNASMGTCLLLIASEFLGKSRKYFYGGDDATPSEYFMDAFRINVPDVPVLPVWKQELWTLGLENNLIGPLRVYGSTMTAWEIHTKGWNDVVKKMVLAWHN